MLVMVCLGLLAGSAHAKKRRLDGPPKPLLTHAREAPLELIAIAERAMAREREERYQDVRELGADLTAYLERRVVTAYETGTWAETKKWVRRNRGYAIALAATAVLFLGGLITSLTFLVSATELGLRIGMNTGALFAAVVNLGRLHESAGFRSDFGLVDRLAFLVFGAILCSLIIAITMHRFAKRGDAHRVNQLDSAVGAAMVLTFGVLLALTLRESLI